MTNKDYIREARMIKPLDTDKYKEAIYATFAQFFEEDNPRFNREKFRLACGYPPIPSNNG